jgi:deazaflavin-dependent oxidoreductase (nitroreductase family)
MERYLRPGRLTTQVLNRLPLLLALAGISVFGTHLLAVRGRSSGRVRIVVVNVLRHRGERYLVSPRGTTQWVRNLRAAGEGELRLGKRSEAFRAVELPVGERPPVLRAYLRRWRLEAGGFFDGVGPNAADSDLLRIAGHHPVFRIEPVTAGS